MTARPIIFSAPMIRALRGGRKTQTRRVLKPQPVWDGSLWHVMKDGFDGGAHGIYETESEMLQDARIWWKWRAGDRLYVREAWRTTDGLDQWTGAQIAAACADAGYKRTWAPIQYEADGARVNWIADPHTFGTDPGRYRHARHMPRWASRLTLIVTDVRVQRLQDISEADAVAEGVESIRLHDVRWAKFTPENLFAHLWNSLHGPDAWDANPWVAAITFDVRKGNIDTTPHKEPTDE